MRLQSLVQRLGRLVGLVKDVHMQRDTIHLEQIQRQYPGLWVAVRDGEVVDARETAYALHLSLHERDIDGVTIFRCPSANEPELVGMG